MARKEILTKNFQWSDPIRDLCQDLGSQLVTTSEKLESAVSVFFLTKNKLRLEVRLQLFFNSFFGGPIHLI